MRLLNESSTYQKGTLTTAVENSYGRGRLVEIEKKCSIEEITAAERLISQFITAITDEKLRDEWMRKKLGRKRTIEMIKRKTTERKTSSQTEEKL